MENNLTASASEQFIKSTSIFSLTALSIKISANFIALSDSSPTIILEGNKLSYNAFPSLKNSGENKILLKLNLILVLAVKPTGTVDLITITAFKLTAITS